jgi:CHAT domain-containing protein
LFGEPGPDLAGKILLLVLPDPLSTVPFQALITKPATNAGPHQVAWLGASNPLALLPSVASLAGLRAPRTSPAVAPQPFVGFGDPTLTGRPECASAPAPQACPKPEAPASATLDESLSALARDARTPTLQSVAPSGAVDLALLRAQCPMPETALELRCMSQALGAPTSAVHILSGATVGAVEAAPLDQFRVIQFATHGLLATDSHAVGPSAEPALLLTPPDQSSATDDGLLRMSAIARLRLNADWVILSASDTGAAERGGQALSGLASAFLYAGARAVLASQWPIDSQAAVLLTTRAFAELAADPTIGRAEAMRRAMAALIARSDMLSHPSQWAAFTLIGEPGPIKGAQGTKG